MDEKPTIVLADEVNKPNLRRFCVYMKRLRNYRHLGTDKQWSNRETGLSHLIWISNPNAGEDSIGPNFLYGLDLPTSIEFTRSTAVYCKLACETDMTHLVVRWFLVKYCLLLVPFFYFYVIRTMYEYIKMTNIFTALPIWLCQWKLPLASMLCPNEVWFIAAALTLSSRFDFVGKCRTVYLA